MPPILLISLLFLLQGTQGFATASKPPDYHSSSCPASPLFASKDASTPFTHADIIWKIKPKEGTPDPELIQWQAQAAMRKLEYGDNPPLIVCPPGGQVLLEAHYNNQRIGKFGITSSSGPLAPLIAETIQDCFDTTPSPDNTGIAAIIYMVVEEEDCKKRGLGTLALDIIGLIHRSVGCQYTVLVADDKSGEAQTLVKWYERQGFHRAPKLQAFMGSPEGQFGITMIGPTKRPVDEENVTIEWW